MYKKNNISEHILLTREEFRNQVFSRDNGKCVKCGVFGKLDAHHILDRKLFDDGGYYINNGVSLCPSCHLAAENGEIKPKDLRILAKIRIRILPYNYDPNFEYDKWGNSIDFYEE